MPKNEKKNAALSAVIAASLAAKPGDKPAKDAQQPESAKSAPATTTENKPVEPVTGYTIRDQHVPFGAAAKARYEGATYDVAIVGILDPRCHYGNKPPHAVPIGFARCFFHVDATFEDIAHADITLAGEAISPVVDSTPPVEAARVKPQKATKPAAAPVAPSKGKGKRIAA